MRDLGYHGGFRYVGPQGVKPIRILQGIASGLLGAKSFTGGCETAALGAILHFFIAFSAATVFYLSSRKLTFMTHQAIPVRRVSSTLCQWYLESFCNGFGFALT